MGEVKIWKGLVYRYRSGVLPQTPQCRDMQAGGLPQNCPIAVQLLDS